MSRVEVSKFICAAVNLSQTFCSLISHSSQSTQQAIVQLSLETTIRSACRRRSIRTRHVVCCVRECGCGCLFCCCLKKFLVALRIRVRKPAGCFRHATARSGRTPGSEVGFVLRRSRAARGIRIRALEVSVLPARQKGHIPHRSSSGRDDASTLPLAIIRSSGCDSGEYDRVC